MNPDNRDVKTVPTTFPGTLGKKSRPQTGGPALWMLEQDRHLSVAEEFRSFKNKLLALQAERSFRVFMLTGTERGVGTSATAFNLGLTLAWDLAGEKTLLVDTHLDRPTLHTAFKIPATPGFLDCVLGQNPLAETVHRSQLAGLDLMPVGRRSSQSSLPFDMTAFTRFLSTVRETYDIVLLDAAPVLRSSLTRMMAAKTDGVILVFEANRTRSEVVGAARSLLSSDGAHLLGGFLNRRRFVIPKWLYRYV
ncbi:MAG: CpsD/CapB family tyrosine-protein kinase [Thermodesulfobacteriota bacterium]